MINTLRETKNVTIFKVEFKDGRAEVLTALTLDVEDEVLLPKLRVLYVRMCSPPHRRQPLAVVYFVEMVASRSSSGVAPLREDWVGVPAYSVNTRTGTPMAGLDIVLEQ